MFRKYHACSSATQCGDGSWSCGINPGDRYQIFAGLQAGAFTISRYCPRCIYDPAASLVLEDPS